jgi:Fe-S oxidoreductase
MSSIVMVTMLVVAWTVFFWSFARRFKLLMSGKPEVRWDNVVERIKGTILYAFGQQRMPRYPLTGWAHIAIFFGFMILLLRSMVLWGRGALDPSFNLDFVFGPIDEMNLLGLGYALVKDLFAVVVLVAAVVALVNRVGNKPKRLTQSFEANLILGIIITMMIADMLYDGSELLLHGDGAPGAFRWWEPAGFAMANVMAPLSLGPAVLEVTAQIGFWTHSALVLLFLNLLPYGKHFHVVTSIPNVFLRDLRSPGRLPPIENLEDLPEGERFGLGQVTDFTWKQMLDFYSCTECGRCTDMCPANLTGKKLSPKHVTIHLRNNLYGRAHELLGDEPEEKVGKAAEEPPAEGPAMFGHGADAVPAITDLVPKVVDPEMLWACTTCRSCERECPVFITYLDKIVGMRRHLVLDLGEVPPDLAKALRGLETNSNPWNISAMDRAKWSKGLEVRVFGEMEKEEAQKVEYLFFVGCAGSFDDRAKKIASAMVQLLNAGGVDYAILGEEEQCTGDIARRAGNEYLFQEMAKANVELLGGYGVKKIITMCPHCYNTFKNEYPDFGGKYEVLTHVEVLLDLVRQKKLDPAERVDAKVVYHDSCYLGRYNDIYDQPRELLAAIPGVTLVDAERSRDRGMCCGAGGAQYFKEEEPGDERVNNRRIDQLLETRAGTIASACPFCMTMLTDGLKAQEKDEEIGQLDVAELLARSCGFVKDKKAKAKAKDEEKPKQEETAEASD